MGLLTTEPRARHRPVRSASASPVGRGLGSLVGAAFAVFLGWVLWRTVEKSHADGGPLAARRLVATFARHLSHGLPRGLGTALLVVLCCVGLCLPGWAVVRRLHVPLDGLVERVLVAQLLGLLCYLPMVLLGGTYLGLGPKRCALAYLITIGAGLVGLAPEVRRRLSHRGVQSAPVRPRTSTGGRLPRLLDKPSPHTMLVGLLAAVLAAELYLVLTAALVYEAGFDARWYHLGVPQHYVAHGSFYNSVRVDSIAITGSTFYQEILYTPALSVFGITGAKAVSFLMLPLLLGVGYVITRRLTASRIAGLVAAILLAGVPVVTWEATTTGNDLLCAVAASLSIYLMQRWYGRPSLGLLAAAMLLAGLATGTKVFGFVSVLAAALLIGAALVRDRRSGRGPGWRPVRSCTVGLIALAVACLPWWIRSAAMTGNPVFPALNGIFHSGYWSPTSNETLGIAPTPTVSQTLADLFRVPWDDLMSNPRAATVPHTVQWGFVVVLGLPLLLLTLAVRSRAAGSDLGSARGVLVLSVAFCYGIYGGLTRYMLVAIVWLIALVVLAVQDLWRHRRALTWVPATAAALVVVTIAGGGAPVVNTALPGMTDSDHTFGVVYYDWNYLYSHRTITELYLAQLPVVRFINAHLTASDKILADSILLSTYLYLRPHLFSGWAYDSPRARGEWDLCSHDALSQLHQAGVTYVSLTPGELTAVQTSPLYAHLSRVYVGPEADLYKVDPTVPSADGRPARDIPRCVVTR
ncbi:glycosyltransferase family 39 protein [Jatrophihabitans telluris]|uniref:Glycosyltransferase family 39 protein n=1 Tax=Jatrophihabitans telluris TaxID=2038343 RepID=A0ABY4QY38_9ACTN|nr:glycosyltransferase family 39 protein [Jatrophihabitans telluris]UQX88187.1 glycosyltransferase family 39 protein [Jatrophihabitans telluris]